MRKLAFVLFFLLTTLGGPLLVVVDLKVDSVHDSAYSNMSYSFAIEQSYRAEQELIDSCAAQGYSFIVGGGGCLTECVGSTNQSYWCPAPWKEPRLSWWIEPHEWPLSNWWWLRYILPLPFLLGAVGAWLTRPKRHD